MGSNAPLVADEEFFPASTSVFVGRNGEKQDFLAGSQSLIPILFSYSRCCIAGPADCNCCSRANKGTIQDGGPASLPHHSLTTERLACAGKLTDTGFTDCTKPSKASNSFFCICRVGWRLPLSVFAQTVKISCCSLSSEIMHTKAVFCSWHSRSTYPLLFHSAWYVPKSCQSWKKILFLICGLWNPIARVISGLLWRSVESLRMPIPLWFHNSLVISQTAALSHNYPIVY